MTDDRRDINEKLEEAASRAEFDRNLAAALDQLKKCRAFVVVTLAKNTDEVEARSHGFFRDKRAIPMMEKFYMAAQEMCGIQLAKFSRDFREFLGD